MIDPLPTPLLAAECWKCPYAHEGVAEHAVCGSGNAAAQLVVVGEAPGYNERSTGVLFSGPSGQLLWSTLGLFGVARAHTYVTNALACMPPVPPAGSSPKPVSPKALAACAPRLHAEADALAPVRPRVYLALGAHAATTLRGVRTRISDVAGKVEWSEELGAKLVFAFHPAAVLRQPDLYPDFARALRLAREQLAAPDGPPLEKAIRHTVLETPADARRALALAAKQQTVACDLETTGLNPLRNGIISVGFGWEADHAYILPDAVARTVLPELRTSFAVPTVRWIGHNYAFDVRFLRAVYGVPARIDGDTMLLHHALDERSDGAYHDLKSLARKYCGAPSYAEKIDRKNLAATPLADVYAYQAADVCYTYQLWGILTAHAAKERPSREGYPTLLELHAHLQVPAANAFAEIELRGIRIDQERLARLIDEYGDRIATSRAHAADLANTDDPDFNPNSTVQVARVLEAMGYGTLRSTAESVIHDLQRADTAAGKPPNPFLDEVLNYRSLLHTRSTYLEGIERRLAEYPDGRLRSSFRLHGTTSGRLASRDPNLQNIPKDSVIKDLFVPSEGHTLVESDYRRLEVGVLAWYSRDPILMRDFAADDFHWTVAQRVFPQITQAMQAALAADDLPTLDRIATQHAMFTDFAQRQSRASERTNDPNELYDWLKTRLRRQSKYVTFGIMYGEGAVSLSNPEKGLGVPVEDAAQFIASWKQTYRVAVDYLNEQARYARGERWVESASGRRRRFNFPPNIPTHIANEAMNFPIQSLASDICLMALTRLNTRLPAEGLGNVLLSVHDSILAEVPTDRLPAGLDAIHEEMTHALLDDELVFEVDMAVGPHWGALQKAKPPLATH